MLALLWTTSYKTDQKIWGYYSDPYDYFKQAQFDLFSADLYAPERDAYFYPRPFTVPLFYKLAGNEVNNIILMQEVMHCLAAFFFCAVLMMYLKERWTQILFIFFWYTLMSWWNIFGWATVPLSESLSISFMFIWLASFLWWCKKPSALLFVFQLLIVLLFSFTRDSWPYVLVIFYGLFALASIKYYKQEIIKTVSLFLYAILIFFVQQKTAEIGERYRLPLINNIIFRVVPNDTYLAWFKDEGMPQGNELRSRYEKFEHWKDIYPLYEDPKLSAFSNWVSDQGRFIYQKFLFFHPENLCFLTSNKTETDKIFAYELGYAGYEGDHQLLADRNFPLFNVWSLIIMNVIILMLFFREKRLIYLLPIFLSIVFSLNAVILFLADFLEKERHLFITNIMIQVIGGLLIILILDSAFFKEAFRRLVSLFMRRLESRFQ